MISGKTEKGFEFEVNENIGKDFRIVMATARLNSDDTLEKIAGTYDFVTAILGKSGLNKLINFAVEKCGFADTEFILEEAKEILSFVTSQDEEVKKS